MKKYITILIVILIFVALGLFAGCNDANNDLVNENNINNDTSHNNENNNENNINNDTSNNNENNINENINDVIIDNILEEKYEVSYMGKSTDQPNIYDSPCILNHLSEKFNIDLSCPPIGAYDKKGIELMIASSILPDCGWVGSGVAEGTAENYFTSGVIRTIPVDILKEYAPIFYASIEDSPYATRLHAVSDDNLDEFLCLYSYRYNYDKIGTCNVMRYDWMKNLNYTLSGEIEHFIDFYYVSAQSLTLDEFADLAYAFTFSDPDMNGENDTYGYQTYSKMVYDHAYRATFVSAYGITRPYTVNESNWAEPLQYSDAVKKAYMKLNEWIQLGIMNTSVGGSVSDRIWNSGRAGIRNSSCWRINEYVGNIINVVPEVELLFMPGLVDNDGTGGRSPSYEIFEFTPSSGFFFVNSNVTDDKLKRIIMLYDYLCIDPEGYTYCNFGEEGVHWDYDKTFNMVSLDQSELPFDEKIVRYAWDTPGTPKATSAGDPDRIAMDSMFFKYTYANWPATSNTYIAPPKATDLNMDIEWYNRENRQARVKAENQFLEKVFAGESNIDTEWDNLKSILETCGYEEYVNEINTKGYLMSEYLEGILVHPADVYPKE